MLSQAQEKFIRQLQKKKYRKKEASFIAEGEKIVNELISSNLSIQNIYALESWVKKAQLNKELNSKVNIITEKQLKKISALTTAQEVMAVVDIPKELRVLDCKENLVLALDNVKDPGNLGTIIRTADWFGIKQIVCSPECVDAFNPKVVQASMGSIFRVQLHYKNLYDWLNSLDCEVYAAHLKGKNLWKAELHNSGVLLMGNESMGISDELMQLVSSSLKIPAKGKAESLNVAVATAIFCAAFSREG